MRIIRLKLDPKVKEYLGTEARSFNISDSGMLEDVFAFIRLKGSGLPSRERIEKMSNSIANLRKRQGVTAVGVSLLISKRKMMLSRLLGLAYFHAIAALPDPIDATIRMVNKLIEFHKKVRQSKCMSCQHFTSCEFGKQYGKVMTNVKVVIDPDYKRKVHAGCPELPSIEATNQLSSAIEEMHTMQDASQGPEKEIINDKDTNLDEFADQVEDLKESPTMPEEDEVEAGEDVEDPEDCESDFHPSENYGTAISGVYDGTHSANALCQVTENAIRDITAAKLAIFDLGKKFSQELTKECKGKFLPQVEMSKDKEIRTIDKVSDITKITPSQQALPSEVFDARLQKKTLTKTQYGEPETKKKILYLLIDNSGSMTTFIGPSRRQLFTRGSLAQVFSFALTRHVSKEGGIMCARFFASNVGPMYACRSADDFDLFTSSIASASFRSGGTSILAAIRKAVDDIANEKDFSKAEILLITDCEDWFQPEEVTKALNGIELNVLDVSGLANGVHQTSDMLRQIATKYYKVDSDAPSITDMVKLLAPTPSPKTLPPAAPSK